MKYLKLYGIPVAVVLIAFVVMMLIDMNGGEDVMDSISKFLRANRIWLIVAVGVIYVAYSALRRKNKSDEEAEK